MGNKLVVLTQNINGRDNELSLPKLENILKKFRNKNIIVDCISLTEVKCADLIFLKKSENLELDGNVYRVFIPQNIKSILGTCLLVSSKIVEEYKIVQKESKIFSENMSGCDIREVRVYSERKNLEIISCYVPVSKWISLKDTEQTKEYKKSRNQAREQILISIFESMRVYGNNNFVLVGDFNFYPSQKQYNIKKSFEENRINEFNADVISRVKEKDVEWTWKGKEKNIDYIFTNVKVKKFYNKDFMNETGYDHTTLVSFLDID